MTNRIVFSVAAMLALGASSMLVAQDRGVRRHRVADPPMVRLDFDRAGATYSWGQPLHVRFSTDRDAFVMVASVNHDGQLKVLYPPSPMEQTAVFGDVEYFVSGRPWSGVSGAPGGGTYGYVFAIASDEPLELSRFASRTGRTWATSYFQFARFGTARPDAEAMIDQVADEVLFDRQVRYGYDLQYFVVEGTRFYNTRSCWGLYCSRYSSAWTSYCLSLLFGYGFNAGITPWQCLYSLGYGGQTLAYSRPRYRTPGTPPTTDKPRDGMPVPPISELKPDTVHWIVPDSAPQAPQNRAQPDLRPTITIVAENAPDTAGLGDPTLRDGNDDAPLGRSLLNRRGIRPEVLALDSPIEPVTGRSIDAMPRVYRPTPVEQDKPRVVNVEPTAPDEPRAGSDPRILRPERADDRSRTEPRVERLERPRQEPTPRVERPRTEPTRTERPRQEPTRIERPRPEPRRAEQPRREPIRVERPQVERPSVERSSPPPTPPRRRVEEPPTRKP